MRFIVAAGLLAAAVAECPNACSGNGDCGNKDACTCYAGYWGNDCSQRACPQDLAFVDAPRGDLNHDGMLGISSTSASVAYSSVMWSRYKEYEYWPTIAGPLAYGTGGINPSAMTGGGWAAKANEAHFYAVCSGKGVCNGDTGTCTCYDGYTGAACQRTTCPNSCSGHGLCRTVGAIAAGGLNSRFLDSTGGVNTYAGVTGPFTYNLWDGNKNQACVCDPGYTGVDCSMRECPRGDDPLTTTNPTCGNKPCTREVQGFTIAGGAVNHNKNYRIQFVSFSGAAYVTNDFTLSTTLSAAAYSANAAAVQNALQGLPNNITGTVTVSVAADPVASQNGAVTNIRYLVTFTALSGNVPAMTVLRGSTNAGSDAVVQPSQYIHYFTVPVSSVVTGYTITATAYPSSTIGFRTSQFTSPTVALTGTTAAALATAVQSAYNSIPALLYQTGTSVSAVGGAGSASFYTVMVVLPNQMYGANPTKIVVANAGVTVATPSMSTDSVDGNQEYSVCSNRGLCDYNSGLCKCFPGYFGIACDTQNALKM